VNFSPPVGGGVGFGAKWGLGPRAVGFGGLWAPPARVLWRGCALRFVCTYRGWRRVHRNCSHHARLAPPPPAAQGGAPGRTPQPRTAARPCPPPLAAPQDVQTGVQLATEVCGFVTIVGGTFMLHTTRDIDLTPLDLDRLTKSERASEDGGPLGAARPGAASAASLRGRRAAAGALEMAGGGGGGTKQHTTVDVGGGAADGADGCGAAAADREDEPLIPTGRGRR
jgi:hypothetical protein